MRKIGAVLLILLSPVVGTSRRPPTALAPPIQEARYVTLGGIEQWITIRGSDRANPVLLVVHGGPGDAQSLLRDTYAVYERAFTIVQWDQRGAGRTYARNPESPPTLERVVADGVELAAYLCDHLSKRKIVVLGHSWGSHLAVDMVQRRPGLFAAYVGTGQVGSWRESVRAQFDFMLARSRAAGDRKKVELMEAIGTPNPNDADQYFSWWRMRNPYMCRTDSAWLDGAIALIRSSPGFTEADMDALANGMGLSGRTTLQAMLATELQETARTFEVPFFVIQGKEDMATPTSVAVRYYDAVKAPSKKLILIDGAGHFALVTHREAFLAALVREVRPFAVKAERR